MLVRLEYPRISNEVIESLFGTERFPGTSRGPAMDVTESEHEIVASLELPGVKKEDVKVTFEKGILTIEGTRKQPELAKDARVLLNEVSARDFRRSVKIAVEIDANNMGAELQDGILRVVLPKAPESRPRSIAVR